MVRKLVVISLFGALMAACSASPQAADPEPTEGVVDKETEEKAEKVKKDDTATKDVATLLRKAAEGEHRSEEFKARNQARNPVETLTFFGLKPDMTVVELWPGAGWYTEILAPVLHESGQLVVALPTSDDPDSYRGQMLARYDEKLQANPELYGSVRKGVLMPPDSDLGEPGSADLVVTFRNFHSWYNGEIIEPALSAVHEVLKPGGVFGVVMHRAAEGTEAADVVSTGYLPQAFVVEKVTAAGFELVEASDINANPADTKDHPDGVWSLPPARRTEENREKFDAIGESDRMTLKFRKL